MSEDRDKPTGNSFTNWYIVSEQIYTIYHSFLSRVSAVNRLHAAGSTYRKTANTEAIGAMGDLFKLYHASLASGAFPKDPKHAEDRKKVLTIACKDQVATRDELNWACDKITTWYDETGFLNIKVTQKKRYDGMNAMAEGYTYARN